MAFAEQLVFGEGADGGQRRRILGHSPGLVGDCAQEIVRLCEGWGVVPADGLRRPVLMSFALMTRLGSLPGELHAVIRVAPGLKPIFHALVLTRAEYLASYDGNPYLIAPDGVFLDAWDRGSKLSRREIAPGRLADVISSSPGPADIGSVDEAVHQIMANRRLLLPLEYHGSDSDRFLALTIAGLPRVLRQELRFAAWVPSGTNRYTLAATYRDSALYASWQPYLMTTILGELGPVNDEYLAGVQRCLRDGDLTGLVHHGASGRVELGAVETAAARQKRTLSAVVREEGKRSGARPVERKAAPRTRLASTAGAERSVRSRDARSTESLRPRRRRRYNPRPGSERVRRGFAALLAVILLAVGCRYLWEVAGRSDTTIVVSSAAIRSSDPQREPTDVAGLYRWLLAEVRQAGVVELALLETDHRRRGLEQLAQAGEVLEVRSREFLARTEMSLGAGAAEPPPGPSSEELHARGRELARDLRLLALAQVSLGEHIDWRDLAHLELAGVQARFDSLVARRRAHGPLEPSLASVQRLVRSVDQRTRQLQAVRTLEALLLQARWEPGWSEVGETAIDALIGARHGRSRQLRDDALLMIRFKRAEHATDVAERAFAPEYGSWTAMTLAVADIFPELLARVQAEHPGGKPPALLRATVDFYTTVARVGGFEATPERLAEACAELARNRAVAFDPAVYGDHAARLRVRWLAALVADGVPAESLPPECYAGGPADEYHAFLALLSAGGDESAWSLLGTRLSEPFLIRWAERLARRGPVTARAD